MKNKDYAIIQFGLNIRALRKSRKISQEELASLAGLHRTYIGMIERGEKNITLINIIKLSRALSAEVCELLESINNE